MASKRRTRRPRSPSSGRGRKGFPHKPPANRDDAALQTFPKKPGRENGPEGKIAIDHGSLRERDLQTAQRPSARSRSASASAPPCRYPIAAVASRSRRLARQSHQSKSRQRRRNEKRPRQPPRGRENRSASLGTCASAQVALPLEVNFHDGVVIQQTRRLGFAAQKPRSRAHRSRPDEIRSTEKSAETRRAQAGAPASPRDENLSPRESAP